MRNHLFRRGTTLLLLLCMSLTACAAGMGPQIHIKGRVLGEALDLGATTPVPVPARVTCNGASITAAADGIFDLAVTQAKEYRCTAASLPTYNERSATIRGDLGKVIVLNFETSGQVVCGLFPSAAEVHCGTLPIRSGTVHGTVAYDTGGPVSRGRVVCQNLDGVAADVRLSNSWPEIATDAKGAYSLTTARPGRVACVAYAPTGDAQRQEVNVTPDGAATLNFQVCDRPCNPVHYHGGPVMHTFNAYLIFWLPKGYTYEPGGGSNAHFQALMQRYFRDVGGSPFYGLLTQYWDFEGHIQNQVTLGGVWVDTTPYHHCGSPLQNCTPAAATRADPLLGADIEGEVLHALQANPSWRASSNDEFFVFTAYGAEECSGFSRTRNCTFSSRSDSFCAYHSSIPNVSSSQSHIPLIYAYIPSAANGDGGCSLPDFFDGPNGDNIADASLNSVSHEQFESVTDPFVSTSRSLAWFDDRGSEQRLEGEIGDKCVRALGDIQADGSNITLNGHPYLLQAEWSNRARGCAFA